jgi:hypothetical protein
MLKIPGSIHPLPRTSSCCSASLILSRENFISISELHTPYIAGPLKQRSLRQKALLSVYVIKWLSGRKHSRRKLYHNRPPMLSFSPEVIENLGGLWTLLCMITAVHIGASGNVVG